ncbi:MAG: hypothetical protein HYZ84_05965, partial [Candidatus Omnitrophica bacterium]|nr:hypothetical protein [Candidatus Omnitrophota bacterium]
PVLEILKTLAQKKQKGVQVSILTDGIFRNKPSAKRLIKTCSRLGLSIDWDGMDTILHEKTVLIDGRHLFIGSHNWTHSSLLENREVSLKIPAGTSRISGGSLSVRESHIKKFPKAAVLDAPGFAKQLADDIDHAQKEILIATFDIDESPDPFQFGTRITQALLRAAARKVKVKILFDASQFRVPETGEILYQYRGMKKAVELAEGGVEVYYDTASALFHAKLAVIDSRICYAGSQNLEMRKDVHAFEATARMSSREKSGQISAYLDGIFKNSVRYFYGPAELAGMPVPVSFIRKGGPFSRLYTRRNRLGLHLYLSLLKHAWDKNSFQFHFPIPPDQRYALRKLKNIYRLIDFDFGRKNALITLLNPKIRKPFSFPSRDTFILPKTFFENGWADRLKEREIFVLMIHLEGTQNSGQTPFWSMRIRDMAKTCGIDVSNLAHANIALERLNLIEIIRDPKITVKNVIKKPNRYRMNPLWNPAEQELLKKKMLEELGLSVIASPEGATQSRSKILAEACGFAKLLNQDEDLEVIRKFLLLIDRYGTAQVNKAVRITARFKHHFALRNVHHTAAILRNWSQGIYK